MDFSGCLNDGAIEPAVVGCRGDFDFTIKFEKIVFSLIPSASVITASVFYIIRHAHPTSADFLTEGYLLLRAVHDLSCFGIEERLWEARYSVLQNW